MERRLEEIENNIIGIKRDMGSIITQFNTDKKTFTDEIEGEFQKHKLFLAEVVEGARKEFGELRGGLNDLYTKTEMTVTNLQHRVNALEAGSSGPGKTVKGYLPQKSMIPKNFSDKAEEWRIWQEEVADYIDTVTPGMKEVLEAVDKEEGVVDELWRDGMTHKYHGDLLKEHTNIWRLLRRITEGEAKKVVMSVKNEDGFRAWQKLKQRFEPGLAARQGIVMAEFSGMVARPAKTQAETITLITEMDRKMKLVEDVTGEEVSEMHARSVLVGILDPMTRQHTAMNHSKSFDQLKKIVQEFANNSVTAPDAMHIGRIEGTGSEAGQAGWGLGAVEPGNEDWDRHFEDINALGGTKGQCWTCKGYGHLARDCPKGKGKGSDGKGKGREPWGKGYGYGVAKGYGQIDSGNMYGNAKGLGKGEGKNGGKGPRYGKCYVCGGDHFMRDCPHKGHGKGGFNSLEGWDAWQDPTGQQQPEHARVLSSIKEVLGKEDFHPVPPPPMPPPGLRESGRAKIGLVDKAGCGCQGPEHELEGWTARVSRANKKKGKKGHLKEKGNEHVKMFRTIEPEAVKAVMDGSGWEQIEFALDSGATETVVGEDMLCSVETKEGPASRRGVEYEIANGELIPNLGEKKFAAVSEEGVTRNITAQVCSVNKALMSVKKVMKAGNRVVFDDDGSYVEDKVTGEKIWATDDGGMFMIKLWVNRKAGF